jgi:hypothetical protein
MAMSSRARGKKIANVAIEGRGRWESGQGIGLASYKRLPKPCLFAFLKKLTAHDAQTLSEESPTSLNI